MDITFTDNAPNELEPELYIRILIAVTKADRNNAEPEINHVREQARLLGVNFAQLWQETDKTFDIGKQPASRTTAMLALKDCITIASMDGNFTLAEKERVYNYASKLDIPRRDVDLLEEWLDEYRALKRKWKRLIKGEL